MSFRAQAWALDAPADVTAHEMLVLLILAVCHNDETDACYPSLDYLSRRAHLSRATVKRALASLEERGLIIRKIGGGRRANEYKLFGVPRLKLAALRPDPEDSGYAHPAHPEPGAGSSSEPAHLFEQAHAEPGAGSSSEPAAGSSFDPPTGIEPEWTRPRGTSSDHNPDAPRDTRIPPDVQQLGLARIAELRAQLTTSSTDEGTHALEGTEAGQHETLTAAGGAR